MKRCFISVGLLILLIAPHAAAVSAESAAVLDGTTGACLFALNADEKLPMASTTKIMTALVAIEQGGSLDRIYTVREEYTGVEGSSMYLKAGEKITLRETLYGLLLMSGNDAAAAIAGECGGSEAFVARMNAKAEELRLFHTHFENPSGLDGAEHYTTARELAKLAAYALQNEEFRTIVSAVSHTADGRTMVNHNRLLRLYDGAIGVKTGYTRASGRCLVSAAERNGRTLVCVTLNDPDDWQDHCALLDEAFAQYESITAAEAGETLAEVPVESGRTDHVPLTADETLMLSLTEKEQSQLRTVRYGRSFLYAPVQQGKVCGEMVWLLGDTEVGRVTLRVGADSAQLEETKNTAERVLEQLFGWLPFWKK